MVLVAEPRQPSIHRRYAPLRTLTMAHYRERQLQWSDITGRFESRPYSFHLRNAMSSIGRLSEEGTTFWSRDSHQFALWNGYCSDLQSFLKGLGRRRNVCRQALETAMREFIQLFEHSTLRMDQLCFEAVSDPDLDVRVGQIRHWFKVVYFSSTYALVSAWVDDKHEDNSLTTHISLATGQIYQTGKRTPMRVPRKYRGSTKRL